MVLYFECPPDVLKDRLLIRGETSGRSDDNEASIVKRIDTFHTTTVPVVEFFAEKDWLKKVSSYLFLHFL
jgi:adenylate kinase family enzyme